MAAKEVLFDLISSILKIPKEEIDLTTSYFEIGGNSINAARILVGLKKKGFRIPMPDFLAAKTLNELLDKITDTKAVKEKAKVVDQLTRTKPLEKFSRIYHESENYAVVSLNECEDNEAGIDYMTHSFAVRDEMCVVLKPNYDEMYEAFKKCWPYTMEAGLSVGFVEKTTGRMVATQMNYDFAEYDKHLDVVTIFPDYILPVWLMVDKVETPLKEATVGKYGGLWLFELIFGTDKTLSHKQNLELTNLACGYAETFAREKGCKGVVISDTSPVTNALDVIEHNYILNTSIQMNTFELEDGTKPFASLPDYETISALYKLLD